MICAGIDAGSRAIKVVLFDSDSGRILSKAIADQGIEQQRLALELFESALRAAQLDRNRVGGIIATGYGRNRVAFADTTITEITCHARGVSHLMPGVQTIIEIGGQDSKVISLEQGGRVRDFAMNDRCAAGTGRFLEVVAARLGVDLPTLGELSRRSEQPVLISSMCVVFAETEIVGLLSEGTPTPSIAAGVQNAIAARVAAMAGRAPKPPLCFTGGVALQAGMLHALETTFNSSISVPPLPQYTGALGAAILAGDQAHQLRSAPSL